MFVTQFVKRKPYFEIYAVHNFFPSLTIKQYGLGCFIHKKPTEEDIQAAKYGLAEVSSIIANGN
jgi:cob(I)alamin adenosyltransferase